MRKILLALTLGLSTVAMAQPDLSVTLNSPAANATIGPGVPLAFDITVTNTGTVDITTSDTVIYYPTLGGNLLTTTVQGQTVPVAWIITNTAIAANGGTSNQVRNFGGLSVQGASAGAMTFCGNAYVYDWTEADSTNNVDCASVMYDPNTVGIAENILMADAKVELGDNSYFAKGTYYVDMVNVSASNTSITVYDLTGKEVFNTPLSVSSNSINEEVSLNLNKGIYIVTINGDSNILSSKKIVVQ